MTERTQNILALFLVVSWLLLCGDAFFIIIRSLVEWLILKPIEQVVKWLFGE